MSFARTMITEAIYTFLSYVEPIVKLNSNTSIGVYIKNKALTMKPPLSQQSILGN